MSAEVKQQGRLELTIMERPVRSRSSLPKVLTLAHLRRLRDYDQVAAVCYRVNGKGIEFLLVKTRGGRWTFPKGSAEPGLTHAQAAALEAYEEAGVHGCIEEAPFTHYTRRNGRDAGAANSTDVIVSAHLCEVSRLDAPQESNRNRTWFSAEKAKQHLQQDRPPTYGAELSGVVNKAVDRIRRLRAGPRSLPKLQSIDSARETARPLRK